MEEEERAARSGSSNKARYAHAHAEFPSSNDLKSDSFRREAAAIDVIKGRFGKIKKEKDHAVPARCTAYNLSYAVSVGSEAAARELRNG